MNICCVLLEDNWNDWYVYRTMYTLFVIRADKTQHRIGSVKIGQIDFQADNAGPKRPNIENRFDTLSDRFFSLGQGEDYYENLKELGGELRKKILIALRDIAYDLALFSKVRILEVTKASLLRDFNAATVIDEFHKLAQGDAKPTEFHFFFRPDQGVILDDGVEAIDFGVKPNSNPPSNVHVLIGRNGVGKTHTLRRLARCHTIGNDGEVVDGNGITASEEFDPFDLAPNPTFSTIAVVSFSAFDAFEIIDEGSSSSLLRKRYIGLRKRGEDDVVKPKTTHELSREFVESLERCFTPGNIDQWLSLVQSLESDPVFKSFNLRERGRLSFERIRDKELNSLDDWFPLFNSLSSGHKIVLLMLTTMTAEVSERTLILMDEPESHLHPPLLSAFVRSMSGLLARRNGVAIVATHSPVVLQEVPKSCVWKISRSGDTVGFSRPTIETFGESIGTLTREIFELEVENTGFHSLIKECVAENLTLEEIRSKFGGCLGTEALMIAHAMINQKNRLN